MFPAPRDPAGDDGPGAVARARPTPAEWVSPEPTDAGPEPAAQAGPEPAAQAGPVPAMRVGPEPAAQAGPVPAGLDAATRWALAARRGDRAAQAALVRATQTEVWRFVAALVDPDAADDLAQETYLRAFRALSSFEGRSSARTWLLGIARRTCADHVRAQVRRRRLDERLAAAARIGRPHPDPVTHLTITDLVRRLPDPYRAAFVLTQLVGLPYAEAAAVEGVPVGTVRSRVARARAELVTAVRQTAIGQPTVRQPPIGQRPVRRPTVGQPAVGQPAVGQPAVEAAG